MHLPSLIEIPARLLLLIAGLIAPGSMVLRALRLPWSLAGAFLISSATLYLAILFFACTGITISIVTLAAALGVVTLAGRFVPTRYYPTPETTSSSAFISCMGRWLPLYLVFWAIVFYRLACQPLTGPDVYFRWSYLAEQMLRFGSLDFYPPRSGEDFLKYFWAESIPPGVASLYTWAYGCGGNKFALWTSPVVALQLISLHELIWRLAHRWGGEIVARRAVLLAAACPLLTWSMLIGQETGMTALSVTGMVWCLQNAGERGGWRWTILAAISAIVAASTREYGPAFAIVGILPFLFMRTLRSHALLFSAVSLPLVLAWPLRVWLLTGNPFFSLDVAGLFPTNPVFVQWTEMFHHPVANTFSSLESWRSLARYLTLWALPSLLGLIAVVFLVARGLKESRLIAVFVATACMLWALSVPHTAGGLFYSLRVLSPAFALLVVTASYSLTLLQRNAIARQIVVVGVAIVLLEALPKTLVLPENPYRIGIKDWSHAGDGSQFKAAEPQIMTMIKLLPSFAKRKLLTDVAGLPRSLPALGIDAVPLWSPDVAWLFDSALSPRRRAQLWQQSGFVYIGIAKNSPTADFLNQHTGWPSPYFTVVPLMEANGLRILQVVGNAGNEP